MSSTDTTEGGEPEANQPESHREMATLRKGVPSRTRRVLARPEFSAMIGALAVFVFFALVAGEDGFLSSTGTINYLQVSAELGIVAAAVALLMIAGEFDVSVGSMIAASGMMVAIPLVEFGWPLWAALVFATGGAILVGLTNGFLVVRTGLPSFIVTLGALFILRGATIALTRLTTDRTEVSGIREATAGDPLVGIFAGQVGSVPVSVLWWAGITALATWVLLRRPFGNWIFASGGDSDAAAKIGVPVSRVKVSLFVLTALMATLVGAIQVLESGSADVLRGTQKEFQAITAAVIGGTLLTGGYGSVIGTAFGALIFGMVSQGIFFTGVDSDWFQVFLGGMLLIAALINLFIRRRVST